MEKKDVKLVVKGATGFITSTSVGIVVRNVLAGAIVSGGPVNVVLFGIGSVLVSHMLGEVTTKYVNNTLFNEQETEEKK